MKKLLLACAAMAVVGSAYATKPCEELKTEIAAKLDAAGVKNYSLEIVEKDKAADAKVLGSCEGGSKNITYSKK